MASTWDTQGSHSTLRAHPNLLVFILAIISAITVFFLFQPLIRAINADSSVLIAAMFVPAIAIGFLYGAKIAGKAVNGEQGQSPKKRSITKIFLFIFVMGGLFSSVNFALNNGTIPTTATIVDDGLFVWLAEFVKINGGATFLIISSITIMAAATRRIIKVAGAMNALFTFVGTFTFIMILSLGLSQDSHTDSEVYLYTFYQAGIIGGALFEMNRLTRNQNYWQDYLNGY